MSIAVTLARYLAEQSVPYDVMQHPHTVTAVETAQASHVPIDRLAKAVVLKGEDGYMLAVIPASCHIQFGDLRRQLGTDVAMATEDQIETLFRDCEPGAVPALGAAYGLKVIVDEGLAKEPEIYLEGGDRASLVHLSGAVFAKLLVDARQAHFAA
ncbi:MAG: YbaK/EbsC family protein [Bradyrhizobium sp.]|nr:YbaK/EbsC family protein [Pseudomonadota bacterium]MDE2469586.1 YbaK/EbsC family protein [Bradyrhizobium sp.]